MLDLSKKEEQLLFCHYTNLRYLPAKENMSRDYTDLENFPELMAWFIELKEKR